MGYHNEYIETLSYEEMKKIQGERLKNTVRRLYENVPFYKKSFDEAGISPSDVKGIEDLPRLPFTEKTDLRDNYPYGLFAAAEEDIVRIHASSGTTGKQTVVGYTATDIEIWSECCARAIAAAGGGKNDYIHVSYGYGLFTGGLGIHYGAEKVKAAVIPVSSGNTARQIQIIKDFGSTILCCTPSYAMYLAESIKESGIKKEELKLKAGIFGAEPWSNEMRLEIEKGLGIKAYDIYGLSEIIGPGVSFECGAQDGMHINEDHFVPEIIDPDTLEVLPDGQSGELVFTCISKEAMPLIRYRTRDIAVIERCKCSCGRTLIKMKKPQGRSDDMLIIRGVNVFPSMIESVLLSLGMSPNYQLVVDRVGALDTLEILVEITPEILSDSVKDIEKAEKKLRSALESTLGLAAVIRLVEPKSIARSEGKAKRVIDKRKM